MNFFVFVNDDAVWLLTHFYKSFLRAVASLFLGWKSSDASRPTTQNITWRARNNAHTSSEFRTRYPSLPNLETTRISWLVENAFTLWKTWNPCRLLQAWRLSTFPGFIFTSKNILSQASVSIQITVFKLMAVRLDKMRYKLNALRSYLILLSFESESQKSVAWQVRKINHQNNTSYCYLPVRRHNHQKGLSYAEMFVDPTAPPLQ